MLILHASRAFVKRYRCDLSLEGRPVEQGGLINSWSGHFIRVGPTPLVLMMNDATLWSIIIPVKGVTAFPVFLPILLERIEEVWNGHGASFDAGNQMVGVFRRTNRSLIGSMNEAVRLLRFDAEDARAGGIEPDWREFESDLNNTPFMAMNPSFPIDAMAQYFAGQQGSME
jgi:hypothetical protein